MSKLTEILKLFSKKESTKHPTSAVILAAGTGSRFGNELGKKQFREIAGIPALVLTLTAFEQCELIDEIVIVTGAEDIERCQNYVNEKKFAKVTHIVAGGADRQASAKLGFDAINPQSEFVAIHDAARCLVTPEIIAQTLKASFEHGAAVAAEPSRDTVKIATESGFAAETPDRSLVWLVKTPQCFLANMYRAAIYEAEQENFRATDDSQLVEKLGFKVKMVDCGSENIKLTYPIDARIAETIYLARQKEVVTLPAGVEEAKK